MMSSLIHVVVLLSLSKNFAARRLPAVQAPQTSPDLVQYRTEGLRRGEG